jgi:hypothetical protein
VCHIITGDKNRPVVKVLFPLHTLFSEFLFFSQTIQKFSKK